MQRLVSSLFFVLFILFIFPVFVAGQEMRALNPVATPARLKKDGQAVAQPVPLKIEEVRANIDRTFSTWNNGDVSNVLADNFYDKSRFSDSMQTNIPKDSKVKVMGMGSVQTLEQRIVTDPSGGRSRVTLGSVTVNSQVEFNDPKSGFVRVPGTNEIIFEMTEKLK